MRRTLGVALALLLLGSARVARGEPPPRADSLRFVLESAKPSLLRLPTERLAEIGAPARVVLHVGGRAIEPQEGPPGPYLSFLWIPDAKTPRRVVGDLRAAGREPQAPSAPPPARWVDDDRPAVERVEWREDRFFGEVASADPAVYDLPVPHAFLAKVPAGGAVDLLAPPPAAGLSAEGTVRVRVEVVGTHVGEMRVGATWGGKDLGVASLPRAAGVGVLEFTCPTSAAPAPGAAATLTLRDVGPPVPPSGDPNDVSDDVGAIWVDAVTIEAPARPHAGPRAVLPDGVRLPLAVVDLGPLLRPHRDPPDPLRAASGADLLVLSTAPLLDGARRLADHHARTGLRAAVLPVDDVYDAVAAGQPSAEAIHDFVARARGDARPPRFLLLVGDADRDRPTPDTIPTMYARTVYNGATASDLLLSETKDGEPGSALATGRLPFREPKDLDAYVERVVRAETRPPADETRRTVRFITSEGRFGPLVDAMLENLFAQVVEAQIPRAYDVEVTFARPASPYGWPPAEFNEKVLADLDAGSLFFTYVGHGWWNGFDDLRVDGRRYPILKTEHAGKVAVAGTPPAMFVIACTTALFDDPAIVSVGEALLARPRGPLAYWGATRVCHPAWNSLIGRQIAIEMFKDPARRLGEILGAAVAVASGPPPAGDALRFTIERGAALLMQGAKVDVERLKKEGAAMYNLLGDPALRLPFPAEDLAVEATRTPTGASVRVKGPFPDGTEVLAAVEVPRTQVLSEAADPSLSPEEAMRRRHARSNDKAVARGTARAQGGVATFAFDVPEAQRAGPLFAKAHAVFEGDVHQGASPLP